MRAWPAPAQGLLATGFSGTITPPLNLSPLSAFGTAIQLNSQQSITYDAANSTGIMNGVNAQTFSVYNTFTAGTPDYERGTMFWSGNVFSIACQNNGTGALRDLQLLSGASVMVRLSSGGQTLQLGRTSTSGVGPWINFGASSTYAATSGSPVVLQLQGTFQDGGTNSSTAVQCAQFSPTINYTGASKTGKVVLANFAPTLTSQPSGKNAGISFSSAFTSSTFPALVFNNVSDEDTNFEKLEMGWHLYANIYSMQMTKGGTGTARPLNVYYSSAAAGTSSAISVPITVGNTINIGPTGGTGLGTATNAVGIGTGGNFVYTATSGTASGLNLGLGFSPSSTSTMSCYGIAVQPTINFSNGTPGAGQVYGIYVKPTNTALPTGLNAGIALASTASGLTGAVMYHNQTDETTNFEYVTMGFNSNIFKISSVKGGTGTLRGIQLGIAGNSIGFLGHAVQALPSAYTLNATQAPSRTLLASASATVTNNNNVLSQLIQDLQGYGLLA